VESVLREDSGSEKVNELWVLRVANQQRKTMWQVQEEVSWSDRSRILDEVSISRLRPGTIQEHAHVLCTKTRHLLRKFYSTLTKMFKLPADAWVSPPSRLHVLTHVPPIDGSVRVLSNENII